MSRRHRFAAARPAGMLLSAGALLCAGVMLGATGLLAGCSSGSHVAGTTSAAAIGTGATLGSLKITGAYVPVPASPDVAAAYFTVTNAGTSPDELVKVTSNVSADTSLHTYNTAGNEMVPLAELVIPAGASRSLAVGSVHVMIEQPKRPLTAGDTVALTLTFTRAGQLTVAAPVVAATGPQDDQSSMGNMPGMTMGSMPSSTP